MYFTPAKVKSIVTQASWKSIVTSASGIVNAISGECIVTPALREFFQ